MAKSHIIKKTACYNRGVFDYRRQFPVRIDEKQQRGYVVNIMDNMTHFAPIMPILSVYTLCAEQLWRNAL